MPERDQGGGSEPGPHPPDVDPDVAQAVADFLDDLVIADDDLDDPDA